MQKISAKKNWISRYTCWSWRFRWLWQNNPSEWDSKKTPNQSDRFWWQKVIWFTRIPRFIIPSTNRDTKKLKILSEVFINSSRYFFPYSVSFHQARKTRLPSTQLAALKNLFKNKEGKRLNPVVLAHQNPKNLRFILDCWRKNILLARLPFIKFNKADNRRLNEIRFAIENSFSGASSPRKIAQQRFIERNFLESGRYRRIAANILSYGKLFEQHKIAHLVVGDAGNGNCRLLLEIANLKNIPADELLNGMFLMNILMCDRAIMSTSPT